MNGFSAQERAPLRPALDSCVGLPGRCLTRPRPSLRMRNARGSGLSDVILVPQCASSPTARPARSCRAIGQSSRFAHLACRSIVPTYRERSCN